MRNSQRRILIIGGTAAGTSVAAAIARYTEQYELILFEQEEHIALANCSLPRFIAGEIEDYHDLIKYDPSTFSQKYGVSVRINNRVVDVITRRRLVTIQDLNHGSTYEERYDNLVFATGSSPRRLTIPGADALNVFPLKNLKSALKLREYIHRHPPKNVVVVGAGAIGLIMADTFSQLGSQVTVIEKETQILNSLDPECAARIEGILATNNIKLYTGTCVTNYVLNGQYCAALRIAPGDHLIKTDLVLEAIGVLPNVELAYKAGVQLGPNGAIRVDQTMKTSQLNMYAVGDCIELINTVTGRTGYYPRGSNAVKTGRIAAENIAGYYSRLPGVLGTTLLECCGFGIGWTGLSEQEAKKNGYVVKSTEVAAPSKARGYAGVESIQIKLVFTREGKILGGQISGRDGVTGRLQTLALAIQNHTSLRALAMSDFGYYPPLTPVWDPLIIAARAGLRTLMASRH